MSLNPWLALILGILIGWLLEWLLELWFFRKRRLECQDTLTAVEARLKARELELRNARLHAESLETDLTRLKAGASAAVAAPAPGVKAPQVQAQGPSMDFDRLHGKVEVPKVGVEPPQVDLHAPELAAELPELKVEGPDVRGKIGGPADRFGAGIAGPSAKPGAEAPEAHVELTEVEEQLPAIDFDRLGAKVETPAVEIEPLKAEVDWPAVAATLSGATAALPDVSVGAPAASIGAELPAGEIGLPPAAIEATLPVAPEAVVDDLAAIKGIGPKYAAQLSAAGITSFAALAAADPQRLRAIVNAPGWRQVDYPTWVAEAKSLAVAPRRAVVGDDLTRLEGIGPVYDAKLRAAGITTYEQLAQAEGTRLAEIIQAPAWRRVHYGAWIEQARLAAAGDEAGLKALQDQLSGRQGDNLDLIDGIGEKTVAALNAAGINSYASLAEASPERLAEITRTAGVRGGNFGAWIEEARVRAAGKRVRHATRSTPLARKVSCPQDLSKVKGVGSAYETKLYAAGIGTFWELSAADDAELKRILEIKQFQQVDLTSLKADALRLAEETNTAGRMWDGTAPDDFEPFEGIGATYEGRLYDAGICTYRALAAATVEQLAGICQAPEWRKPDYAGWIAQAKRLINQEG